MIKATREKSILCLVFCNEPDLISRLPGKDEWINATPHSHLADNLRWPVLFTWNMCPSSSLPSLFQRLGWSPPSTISPHYPTTFLTTLLSSSHFLSPFTSLYGLSSIFLSQGFSKTIVRRVLISRSFALISSLLSQNYISPRCKPI